MGRLSHALIAFVVVVPALAAPGPMLAGRSQKPMGNPMEMPESITTTAITGTYDKFAPTLTLPSPPATATTSIDLRKKMAEYNGVHRPGSNGCTPGDRACHASLDEILFCNDDHQWASYGSCQAGTFCHRLDMVCVPIVTDPPPKSPHKATSTPTPQSHGHGPRGDDNQCKEGDRRCNVDFNRVDRCNSGNDWVTYHDCRKAEFCDDRILECLPYVLPDPKNAIPGVDCISNSTATKTA
ncbi:hypothetical protein GGR58DRAFT_155829 [Xylaria digitata]|nr:hypothetical protein GGR58DRAFT_155829 [Xylaria digitata]